MSTSTLCLGEALIDEVTSGDSVTEHVGGSPLNVAVGLARLGHATRFGSWWGSDARGERIAAALAAADVAVEPGSDRASFTTVAHATLDSTGQASYVFEMESGMAPLTDLSGVGHIHTGSIGAALDPGGSAIAQAVTHARPHATISYDPNVRPTLMGSPDQARPRIEQLIAASDVVKASDEDLGWLYPGAPIAAVMRAWADLGPRLLVITRGGDGAAVLLAGLEDIVPVAPNQVTVADTVGAGDSFMAGLVGGLLDAKLLGDVEARERLGAGAWPSVSGALRQAIATSSVTVSHHGAYAPTPEEVAGVVATLA